MAPLHVPGSSRTELLNGPSVQARSSLSKLGSSLHRRFYLPIHKQTVPHICIRLLGLCNEVPQTGCLGWQKFIVSQFQRWVWNLAVSRALFPLQALGGICSRPLSWLLVKFLGLRQHNSNLCMASPCVCVCLHTSHFPFYKDATQWIRGSPYCSVTSS